MSKLFKSCGMVVLLGGIVLLGACANDNGTDNGADAKVAGANQDMVYGYIVEINEQARTVLVDEFDLIADTDTERIGDLGLDRNRDFINGYNIYNTGGVTRLYPLSDTMVLRLADFDYHLNDYYNDRWNNNNSTNTNNDTANSNNGNATFIQGLTDDLTNNYDTKTGNNTDTLNSLGNNNAQTDNDNVSGSNVTNYNIDDLRQRLGQYDNIPFMLTIENGKVVRIEELDNIYR